MLNLLPLLFQGRLASLCKGPPPSTMCFGTLRVAGLIFPFCLSRLCELTMSSPITHQAFSSTNLVLLGGTYFFYFGQFGVVIPYLGVFLDDKGFSSAEIGELFALMVLARIAGPNLWAWVATRSGQPLRCLQLGALLTLGTFCLAFVANGFWALTATFAIMMMFWTAILPQIEVLTLNCVRGESGIYGKVRLWGSVGYILLVIFTGMLLDHFGAEVPIFVGAAVLLMLFLMTLLVTYPPQDNQEVATSVSLWSRINTPAFYAFIASAMLLQVSFGAFYGFFALYTLDLGYSGQVTGALIGLGVLAEVVIFIYAGKLIHGFGLKAMLFITMLLTALRWYLLGSFADNIVILFASQLLHAFSYGMAHSAAMSFIHQHFGPKHQSQGQAMYASIAFGLGGAVGHYVAGYTWQQGAGSTLTFSIAAAAAAGAALCVLLIPRDKT